jgi:hypothetical protein
MYLLVYYYIITLFIYMYIYSTSEYRYNLLVRYIIVHIL